MNVDEVKHETEEDFTAKDETEEKVRAKDKDEVKAEDVGKDREDATKDFNYKDEDRASTKMCHVDSLSRNTIMVIRDDNTLLKIVFIVLFRLHILFTIYSKRTIS